jgi:hypothetical protein
MASCEDVPSPYGTVTPPPTPSEVIPTGDGTATNPFNVTAAVAKCKEIGTTESTEKYYVTGVVVTAGAADASYGNATFTIADEGGSAKFICFQVLGTDGKKMEEGYTFDVGDVVIVYGPMYNYKGNTPETAGKGAAWVLSRNGEPTAKGGTPTPSGDPKGTGTKDDPFNIAAAIAKCVEIGTNPSTEKYYIKGFAVKDATASGGYGNISIDLGDTKDATSIFKAFQVAGTDGEKLKDGYEVKAGSEVVVYGPIYNYQGNTPETAGKSAAQIVTINGKKTSDSGGDTPTETLGTKDNPLTVAKALEYISALEDNAKTDKYAYVKGTIKTIKTKDEDIAKYKNIDYIITDGTNEVTVFRGKNLNNTDFTAAGQINVGDEVVVYGQLTKYVKDGNVTPEVAQGNYLVSLKSSGSGGGGGDTPSGGNDGSLAKPFTPAEANAFIATLAADTNTDKDYYIKGKLVEYAKNGEFSTQYGNASFYLSADGTKSGDQFYVFRTLYLGNVKYTEGTTPAVGDEIIICGQLVNYKGNTPETVANKSYIYSLNGNTK